MQKQEKIIALFNLFYIYLRHKKSLKSYFVISMLKKSKIIPYIYINYGSKFFFYNKFFKIKDYLFKKKVCKIIKPGYKKNYKRLSLSYPFKRKVYLVSEYRKKRILRICKFVNLKVSHDKKFFPKYKIYSYAYKNCIKLKSKFNRNFKHKLLFFKFNHSFNKNFYKIKNLKKYKPYFIQPSCSKFFNVNYNSVYYNLRVKKTFFKLKRFDFNRFNYLSFFINKYKRHKSKTKKSKVIFLQLTKKKFFSINNYYNFFIKINSNEIKKLLKIDKMFLNYIQIFLNTKLFTFIKFDTFFYNFFFKFKVLKKKKSVLTVLFKRRNFFYVTHIYFNNKLFFVSTSEFNLKKKGTFSKYLNYIFKVINYIIHSNINFTNIFFIIKLKKAVRRKNKNKTKTYITISIFKRLLNLLACFFFDKKLKKKVKIKYLYSSSHSFKREKIKKKRRK